MLDDGDKAISYDCRANLYSDSVLCSAPEFLNLEVLLEPLEEQLNLPSVLVEIGNFESGKMECIRQKCEVSILLVIVKSHQSQPLRILILCVHIRRFVWMSIIKSTVFAFIIASVSSFCGYTVEGGSVEVGKASTSAVVNSSILILFSDVFLTQLLS